MEQVIQIGPLMLAMDRLVAIMAIWAFLGMSTMIGARTKTRAARASWIALTAGIVAARIGFVIANWPAFSAEPWTIIALWQGGFAIWPGVIAAALVLAGSLGKTRATAAMIATLSVLTATFLIAQSTLLASPATPFPQNIRVARLDGQSISLDTLRGKPFVLNLWATWCPPCRREMPMVIDVARGSNVAVLLVNQGEDVEKVRRFLAAENLPADDVVLDPRSTVGSALGSPAFPTTIFVDAGGRIRSSHAGEISRAALMAAIRDLERNPR
ncbi:MAG: TlpA disulfide reductase family protein [Myxococcota bacterium]|jgi:thiol-disulfide isomerase/thioredoxin